MYIEKIIQIDCSSPRMKDHQFLWEAKDNFSTGVVELFYSIMLLLFQNVSLRIENTEMNLRFFKGKRACYLHCTHY